MISQQSLFRSGIEVQPQATITSTRHQPSQKWAHPNGHSCLHLTSASLTLQSQHISQLPSQSLLLLSSFLHRETFHNDTLRITNSRNSNTMLLKPLSVAALAAASASAFLIPPNLSVDDIHVWQGDAPLPHALPNAETSSEKVTLDLACPGCPIYAEKPNGEGVTFTSVPPNHLELSFTIEHGAGNDRLLVNGFELYPSADPFQTLAAPQANDRKEARDLVITPQRLGYSLQASPVAHDAEGGLELVIVDLQIIEVGDVFIKDIPNVRVKVIKVADGGLMIGGIETTASQTPGSSGGEDCETVMCKWIAFAQDKLRQMKEKVKGCHGGSGKGVVGGADRGMGHHGQTGHGHGHGHHAGEQPQQHTANSPHTFGKLIKNIFMHILLPVLIGIVAGVSVSL